MGIGKWVLGSGEWGVENGKWVLGRLLGIEGFSECVAEVFDFIGFELVVDFIPALDGGDEIGFAQSGEVARAGWLRELEGILKLTATTPR